MAAVDSHDYGEGASPGRPSWGAGPVPPIALVALIVLVGTSLSIGYHYVMGAYLGLGHHYGSFLFKPRDHFMDFFNVYRHAQEYGSGNSDNMVYSPLLHLIMTVSNLVPAWVGFAAMTAAFVATLAALLWTWTMRLVGSPIVRAMFASTLCLLSYPVLFALDRGNLEMLVFIMLAAFFYLYYWRRSPYAWVALSLAVAAKYYWITLVVLLLLDRRIRQAVACVVGAVAVTVASTVVIGLLSGRGVIDVLGSLSSTLATHVGKTTSGLGVAAYSHSLWVWGLCIVDWSDTYLYMTVALRVYLLGAAVIMLLVIRRLQRGDFADWQKATALVACTLVLPYESVDYNLIHLLLPLSLFAATWHAGRKARLSAVLFGLLLIPLDYYYFVHLLFGTSVSSAALVYPLLLLGLIVVVIWDGKAGDAPLGRELPGQKVAMLEAPP
jgi:Glycosyltransferase family 87